MALHLLTTSNARADLGATPAGLIRAKRAEQDWYVEPASEGQLLGVGAPNWFALEDEPRAQKIKEGHHRRIWRVDVGGSQVVAKVFGLARGRERFKHWILGSAAEREWRALREAHRREVSTVRSLAVGVRARPDGSCVLITEAVPKARNLAQLWTHYVESKSWRDRGPAAREMLKVAAELFATAHDRGFVHRDAHPSNILAAASPDAAHYLKLVDVYGGRFLSGPAGIRPSAGSLAQLDQYFHRRATRTERLRFVCAYLAARSSSEETNSLNGSRRTWITEVRQASTAHAAGLARRRDRRLRQPSPYFASLRLGAGWRARVALRLERRHVFAEPNVPDRSEDDWRTLIAPVLEPMAGSDDDQGPAQADALHVERLRPRGIYERLEWTLLGSPPRLTFERCHRLRHRDVPAPLVLGFAEHRTSGWVDCSLLLLPPERESTESTPTGDPSE